MPYVLATSVASESSKTKNNYKSDKAAPKGSTRTARKRKKKKDEAGSDEKVRTLLQSRERASLRRRALTSLPSTALSHRNEKDAEDVRRRRAKRCIVSLNADERDESTT